MVVAATRDEVLAGSSYELMSDQLLDAHDVKYAISAGVLRLATTTRARPEFATAPVSAYNDWMLKNPLKRSSRKTRHPAGDHSRCSSR